MTESKHASGLFDFCSSPSSIERFFKSAETWRNWNAEEIPSTTSIAIEMLEKLPPVSRILDLGCGIGKSLEVLATLDADTLTGVDVNVAAVARARSKWNSSREAAFIAGDALHLPFPDNSFDVATAQAFLTVVPTRAERLAALREAGRILRPGGYIYIGDFLQNSTIDLYVRRYVFGLELIGEYGTFPVSNSSGGIAYFAHHFTEEELEVLIGGAGFELKAIQLAPTKTYSGHDVTGISVVAELRD